MIVKVAESDEFKLRKVLLPVYHEEKGIFICKMKMEKKTITTLRRSIYITFLYQ